MKYTVALAAAFVASVAAQGVTQLITPTAAAPAGCKPTYAGTFQLRVAPPVKKREVEVVEKVEVAEKRQLAGYLTCTLENGVLLDSAKRVGYIADNYQFQFDGPPQAGAIITAGWTMCPNGTLALGGSTVLYQCLSGQFYNLYDRHWAAQCEPVHIALLNGPASSSSSAASSTPSITKSASGSASASAASASASATGVVSGAISENSSGGLVATTPVSNSTVTGTGSILISSATLPTPSGSGSSGAASSASRAASGGASGSSGTPTGAASVPTPMAQMGALAIGILGAVAML